MRARLALALLIAACALVGCGSDDPQEGIDPNDHRALALSCLTEEKGVEARAVDPDGIRIGEGTAGPHIRFYTNSGEAEAAQFQGEGEGAEHIGRALFFVGDGSEDLLQEIEDCLSDVA